MPPTVLLDEALRAAIIRAAEQQQQAALPARRSPTGTWAPKPPVLPCIPLQVRRSRRPLGLRTGVQLKLFDPRDPQR